MTAEKMNTMAQAGEDGFKPRILVVDDEKRIRDGCHKMLTKDGFEVALADTGGLGLEMIEREHFDLILLDLMMPGLSGLDVLQRVTTLHPHTAIIVITGYATLEHSIEAMKQGAFDFIPKPFSPQELRVVVAKAIEYIRTLQDIAHEKSRMRVLVDYLNEGVLATDAQHNVALANPAFMRMIGRPGEESTGRTVNDLIEDDKLKEMIDAALCTDEKGFIEFTEELIWPGEGENGETVIGTRVVPFRDRIGRNRGAVTVLRDVTTAKKMDQLKSDFVSMVAHEIRNPMNSVLMQLKVVRDGLAGEVTDKQQEILGRSSERIKALVKMASELLDLAKIESGLITYEKENLDMADVLASQVTFHQARAQAKNIELALQPLPDLPPVPANRQNMDEVLSNLIANAINYTPKGGRVTVSAGLENQYFRLCVSDTGLGIPEEEIERIFGRFYRVKNEKTRLITGTGLGLPIVKSIIDAHNGSIRVESELDRGTTFFVYLPLMAV